MVDKTSERYGVVLDAGSSGTRVYIYRWHANAATLFDSHSPPTLPELETKDKWTKKVHPGVSTFGDHPDLVGPDHLKPLLQHALKYIPENAVADTPIFLLATAGMRLLPNTQQKAVLRNICSYIRSETKFSIPDCDVHVQVIPGETEGLYGWIAANYLLGGFDTPKDHDHGKGHHTYGFLDMGGASAQIAFAPNATEAEKHANDLTLLRLRTINGLAQEYKVFVTTWLGFGANEARRRYVDGLEESYAIDGILEVPDPCLPFGLRLNFDGTIISSDSTPSASNHYLLGTGKFDECLRRTFPLLEKDIACLDEPCLVHGVHVPAIDFEVNHFVGVSEYWHTTHEIFEFAHKDKSYDFTTYQQRVKEFCEQGWSDIQKGVASHEWGKKVDEKSALEVCFKASWLINLLHDGIGIPRVGLEDISSTHNGTKEILEAGREKGYLDPFQAVNKIKSTEVSWTMGKMLLYASASIPPASEKDLPVGFGSNVPDIPADFQYPSGGRLQSISDHSSTPAAADSSSTTTEGSQSITDTISSTLFKSDAPHRLPGFIFFLLIVTIAAFYLCGRERRAKIYRALHLSKSTPSPSLSHSILGAKQSSSPPLLGSPLNFFSRLINSGRNNSIYLSPHHHDLEDQRLYDPADFELNDFSSSAASDDDEHRPSSSQGGRDSPRMKRYSPGATTSPKRLNAKAKASVKAKPAAIDRAGLVVRTESRESLSVGGAGGGGSNSNNRSKSKSRGASPVR